MTPSASLLTFVTSTGLAGLALTFLKDCAQACRPIASSLFFQRVNVVLPGRRSVASMCSAYPCHLQCSCVRFTADWLPPAVEIQSTASEVGSVPQVMGDARDCARV